MSFLKHSGRRAFLKGLGGLAISMPLLELTHGHAFAQGVPVNKRFLTLFTHGGHASNQTTRGKHDGTAAHHGQDHWRPADPGESLVLGPIHEPLERFREKLLVLESIDNMAAVKQHQYHTGGHGTANVTVLTCADVDASGEDPIALGPSLDFVLAERLAALQPVRFNRIHLTVRGHQYGTPYARAAGEPTGGEDDPRQAFATIFEGITATGPDPAFVKRQKRRTSILDGVLAGFSAFRTRVSAADVHVVDAHLEHLRELEQAIEGAEMAPVCVPPEAPSSNGGGDLVGPLHAKIIVAAIRCGLTNVANLEIADILTPWTPAGLKMDSAYNIGHSLGHYGREVGPTGANSTQLDDWLLEMRDNRRWRTQMAAEILAGLDDPDFLEGGRTILDNSLMLYTSEFSDASGHMSVNTPVLLAGSAGGVFRTGRHLDYNTMAVADPLTRQYATNESLHNLYTSILQAFGGTDAHFGSDHAAHEGPLPGLT